MSTPQVDVKYDAQLQNLQHQLYSIPLTRTQTTVNKMFLTVSGREFIRV